MLEGLGPPDARAHLHPDHALAAAGAHGRPDRRARRRPHRGRARPASAPRARTSGCSTAAARAVLERSLGPGERLGDIAVGARRLPAGRTHARPTIGPAAAMPCSTAGREKAQLPARVLRRRRGRDRHVAAVRPAAAALGAHPDELARRLDLELDGEPVLVARQAAGAGRAALGRARAEGLRQPRRVRPAADRAAAEGAAADGGVRGRAAGSPADHAAPRLTAPGRARRPASPARPARRSRASARPARAAGGPPERQLAEAQDKAAVIVASRPTCAGWWSRSCTGSSARCRRRSRCGPRTATSTSTSCCSTTTGSPSSTSIRCASRRRARPRDLRRRRGARPRGRRRGDRGRPRAAAGGRTARGRGAGLAPLGGDPHPRRHPFHRQVPAWRERMEAMVTTAEEVIHG